MSNQHWPRYITAAEVEGEVIPTGGTTNQVLAKQSNADFDLKWATGGGGGGEAALELTSTGDVTDTSGFPFTADNSGIKQVDKNDVVMFTLWSGGTVDDCDGSLYIGDVLPAGFGPNAQDNVAVGQGTMAAATDPDNAPTSNTAIGSNALKSLTNGQSNVAVGQAAAQSIDEGANNVVIGQGTDILEPGGSQIVIIGGQTDTDVGVTDNAIGIGYAIEVKADNQAVIGNGNISEAIFGCPSVSETSGLLIIGRTYRITNFATDDDFTNVGASSNETGEVFTATGTTPTDWSHGSTISTLNPYGNAILNGKADFLVFPDSDPHVAGAAYWVGGVLTKSTG